MEDNKSEAMADYLNSQPSREFNAPALGGLFKLSVGAVRSRLDRLAEQGLIDKLDYGTRVFYRGKRGQDRVALARTYEFRPLNQDYLKSLAVQLDRIAERRG